MGSAVKKETAVKALQNRRQRAGLTQEKLVEKAGISPRYPQEIEIGTRVPSLNVLEALRGALLCTWNELLREGQESGGVFSAVARSRQQNADVVSLFES